MIEYKGFGVEEIEGGGKRDLCYGMLECLFE